MIKVRKLVEQLQEQARRGHGDDYVLLEVGDQLPAPVVRLIADTTTVSITANEEQDDEE